MRALACLILLMSSGFTQRAAGQATEESAASGGALEETLAAEQPRSESDSAPQRPAAAAPLKFRRVYLSEKDLPSRTDRGEKYLPIDSAEFEARVKSLRRTEQTPPDSTGQIAAARYLARVDGQMCLTGTGTWDVVHVGKKPALVQLSQLRFALSDLKWSSAKGDNRSDQPAKIGVTKSGISALYFDRSGALDFQWSLAGNQEGDRAWTYALSFPPAPSQRLELTLPERLVVSMESAVISVAQSTAQGMRTWTLLIPRGGVASLRIVKAGPEEPFKPQFVVKPKSTYEITTEGLQLLGEWRIDVHGEPIEQLAIDLDPTLTLASAQIGETSISWREVKGNNNAQKHIVLDFPNPVSGPNRLLRLSANARAVVGENWTLPRVSAAAGIWQDGTTAVVVPSPLALDRLDLVACKQTKREQLPAPAAGEAIGIQEFTPMAVVRVVVAPRAQRVEITSATAIDLRADEALASYVAEIECLEGECFRLEADISPDWIIDSVQSSPAGMIADWDRQRGRGAESKLVVHLAKTINPERPLRLVIAATGRRAPLGETIGVDDIRLLTFRDMAPVRRLVMLNAQKPLRLEVHQADDLLRLDPEKLNAHDRGLFERAPSGLLFVADESAADLRVRLVDQRPRHLALVQVRAVVGQRELTESYQLRVEPESTELDRLRVHFSTARAGDLRWLLAGDGSMPLSSRRLTLEEQLAAGLGEQGETWDIQLPAPRREPFVMTAKRTSKLTPTAPVSLLSVLNTTLQRGNVMIELATEYVPELATTRVKQLVTEPDSAGKYGNVLAAFEYDPAQEILAAREPALILVVKRDAHHRRRAWIWQCLYETWLGRAPRAGHRVTFWLQNEGRRRFSIQLPVSPADVSVEVDGRPTTRIEIDSKNGQIEVPLPDGRQYCLIQASWSGEASALQPVGWQSFDWPTADIPILARYAKVWLPAGYELAGLGGGRQLATAQSFWRQRLFGPFARRPDHETFEPWLARDWWQMMRRAKNAEAIEQWVSRFLNAPIADQLVATQNVGGSPARIAWGELLYRAWYGRGRDSSPPSPLAIHLASIEEANIHPEALVDRIEDPVAPQTIGELLRRHSLLLLIREGDVLLVAKSWAASNIDPSIAGSRQAIVDARALQRVNDPPDSEARGAVQETVLVDDWSSLPDAIAAPWIGHDIDQSDGVASTGWRAYSLEASPGAATMKLAIVNVQTWSALGLAAFLAVAGLVWRSAPTRPLLHITALGIFVIATLLLPAALAPISAACLWGFTAGHLCRWISNRPQRPPEHSGVAPQAVTAATALVLLLASPWPFGAAAQVKRTADDAAESNLLDVLIPWQADDPQASRAVYVPERLYRALFGRDDQPQSDGDYLITAAAYDGAAAVSGDGKYWRATFQIEVLHEPAHISLPFGTDTAQIVPDTAQLNGQPIRFSLDGARRLISLDIAKAGTATVTFEFQPAWRKSATSRALGFAIPAVPQSTLSLALSNSAKLPRLNALGAVVVDQNAQRLTAELGSLDKIDLSVGDDEQRAVATAEFESEETSWLKVRPGSALLNVRHAIDVRRGALGELRLAVDKRLQLAPPVDDMIESVERLANGNELRLRFARPLTEHEVIDLSFGVDGVTGDSNFSFPKVEVVGASSSRRYVACTADSALEISSLPAEGMRPLNAGQFAALWGEAEARPLAFELPPRSANWTLSVRPRQARLSADYQTIVIAQRNEAFLHWNAAIDISGGSRFQFRLNVPSQLLIDRLDVRDAAGVRSSHWALADGGVLTVFVDSPATGKIDVSLIGRIPIGEAGETTLPLLKLEESAAARNSLVVLRRSNAVASVELPPGLPTLASGDIQQIFVRGAAHGMVERPSSEKLRVVAAFATGDTSSVKIKVEKNEPRADAIQVMSLTRRDDTWQAALDLSVRVTGGLLDVVRIDAPAEWSQPFRVEPPMPLEVTSFGDGQHRQLLLFPSQPIADEAHIRIEGSLVVPSGERVRVSHARIAGASALDTYVALPARQDLQALIWETHGLTAAPLPDGMVKQPFGVSPMQTFAAAEPFDAELRSAERVVDNFQVRLADIAVSWTSDFDCFGVATFDIDPAGKTSCRLALPDEYHLLDLQVDGRAAPIAPAEADRWQIPLSGGRLPQCIQVTFQGHWSNDSSAPELLEAPRLIGLPVQRTLWTISGPRSAELAQITDAQTVSKSRAQQVRFTSLAASIESSVNGFDGGADEMRLWYQRWVARLIAARRALDRGKFVTGQGEDASAGNEVDRLADEQRQLAQRQGLADVLTQASQARSIDKTAIAAGTVSPARDVRVMYALVDDASHTVRLRYTLDAGDWRERIGWTIVTAIILLAVAALLRYTTILQRLWRSPRMLLLMLGLSWWLLLWPSAVGWLIVAVAAIFPYARRLAARPREAWRRFVATRVPFTRA